MIKFCKSSDKIIATSEMSGMIPTVLEEKKLTVCDFVLLPKGEIIDILKSLEGLKRKLQPLLKE